MPAIGDVLAGKYRVHLKLGEGGMGAVFRAENIVTGKHVALKWMHPHVAARSAASIRLVREAQATSQFDHPNIVDVYDIVQDDQALFMVMELLEGETLRAYLSRAEPAKISELIALLLPAIDGVAVAHENGVIHRDLKPDNIFLARSRSSGRVSAKVLDFGVAKLATSHGPTLTETGMTMGTPLYMSLEQLRGDRDVDGRADVYAFGAMLYEAIAGATPFQADTLHELVFKVATTLPRPLKELRPDVPTPLARLVDWAIARDREQRVPDLRALLRELEPFAQDRGFAEQLTNPDALAPRLAVRMPGAALSATAHALPLSAAGEVAAHSPDTFKARVIVAQQRRKRMPLAWLVGAAALALIVALTLWLQEQQPLSAAVAEPSPPTAASAATAPPTAARLDLSPPAAAPPTAHTEPRPSVATSSAAPAPGTAEAAMPIVEAAPADMALDTAKTPTTEAKPAPPPPAAPPTPNKPTRSTRAPQPRAPSPEPVQAAPQPQVQRPTQAGKTAAQVLGF